MSRLVFLLIAVLAWGECIAVQTVFVDLRTEAVVDRPEITLAEIAGVFARDEESSKRVGRLSVAHCASLASGCRLDKDALSAIVEGQAREFGVRVVWSANKSVLIKGRARKLPLTPAIEGVAVRIVQLFDQGNPVAVDVLDGPTSIDVPIGLVDVQPQIDQLRRTGPLLEIPLLVSVDGKIVAKFTARYALRRVAATGANDFGFRVGGGNAGGSGESDLSKIRPPAIANGGRQKILSLASQQNVVEKNQKVRLLIESGLVRVEADGISLAAAGIGDLVRVKRTNGLAGVSGRVIDHGTVLVVEN